MDFYVKNIFLSIILFIFYNWLLYQLHQRWQHYRNTTQHLFNGIFTGYIFLEDGRPYSNGTVKASGDNWESLGYTDEFGEFKIEVFQESRFIFSAFSPFSDNKFYPYSTPIAINEEETDISYDCIYDTLLEECFQELSITGTIRI